MFRWRPQRSGLGVQVIASGRAKRTFATYDSFAFVLRPFTKPTTPHRMSGTGTFHGTLNPPGWMSTLGEDVWGLAVVANSAAALASDRAIGNFCNVRGKDIDVEVGTNADRDARYASLKSGSFTSAVKTSMISVYVTQATIRPAQPRPPFPSPTFSFFSLFLNYLILACILTTLVLFVC